MRNILICHNDLFRVQQNSVPKSWYLTFDWKSPCNYECKFLCKALFPHLASLSLLSLSKIWQCLFSNVRNSRTNYNFSIWKWFSFYSQKPFIIYFNFDENSVISRFISFHKFSILTDCFPLKRKINALEIENNRIFVLLQFK